MYKKTIRNKICKIGKPLVIHCVLVVVLLLINEYRCFSQTSKSKAKNSAVDDARKEMSKNLIGKWTSGSLDKGLKSLVLGEGGNGTYTFGSDISFGDNGYCRCKYSSKISCNWKIYKDSLIVTFAKTSVEDGDATPSADANAQAQTTCKSVTCDIVKVATSGETYRLKGNVLRDVFIIAGNTLDWGGIEFKKE